MRGKKEVFLMLSLLGAASIFIFQNCGGVSFGTIASQNSTSGTGTPGGGGGTGTVTTIRTFQPALAARDFSCIACHANVQANLITDFGYDPSGTTSFYFNGFQDPTSFGNDHYTITDWQTIDQVVGQIIVPIATVPASFVNAQLSASGTPYAAPVDLVTYLTDPNIANFGSSWFTHFNEPMPTNFSYTYPVAPPAGMNPVVAQSTIYIGAPTQTEILAIIPSNTSPAPWAQAVGQTTAGVTGFAIATGVNGQQYITNTAAVQCSGQDVVINGTLLLNNLQVYAEKGGCRLYVTGSVFIQGPITYLNSTATVDATDNIQITSATSIIMGVGLNGEAVNGGNPGDTTLSQDTTQDNPDPNPSSPYSPLEIRLLGDIRSNMVLRAAPTPAAYLTLATSIYNEGANIGLPLLQDASVPGTLPTAASAAIPPQQRASITFQHILLNAPLIHSRYMGTVYGVIVAESPEFSLGAFSFQYDPIFETVPVLPALPYDILCSDSSACNPTTGAN
jgi:hypothetical protein